MDIAFIIPPIFIFKNNNASFVPDEFVGTLLVDKKFKI